MVYLKIWVRINPNKQHEFEQAVTHILNDVNYEDNYFEFDLTKSLDDLILYLYSEEWECKELLMQHIKTDLFHSLLGAMKVLGDIIDSKIIYSETEEKLVL